MAISKTATACSRYSDFSRRTIIRARKKVGFTYLRTNGTWEKCTYRSRRIAPQLSSLITNVTMLHACLSSAIMEMNTHSKRLGSLLL